MTIRETQEWLCLHGLIVKIDGIDGPATQAALREFQRRNLLTYGSADVDHALTRPLAAASDMTKIYAESFAGAVTRVAKHLLKFHPREVGGQNRGPWVRYFMRGKEGVDYPWCCGAVSVILALADTVFPSNPFAYTMSCDALAGQAYNKNRLTEQHTGLQPGSLFLLRGKKSGDWVHTGVVTAFNVDHFLTVEGNSNDEGSREGHEMCARIRAYNNVDFVRL